MTFRRFSCVAFFAVLFASLFSHASSMHSYDDRYKPFFAAAESVNTFGAKLLVEYRKNKDMNGNMVFSPLNLAKTFQLLYKGAGGTTKTQIDNLLKFSNPDVESSLTGKGRDLATRKAARMAYRLCVDNSVYLYKNYVRLAGARRFLSVNFANSSDAARTEINELVNKKMHGLIPELLSAGDVSKTTIMALVNAAYFKGKWKYPLKPRMTKRGVFHGVHGNQNISYMKLRATSIDYKRVPELGGRMFEVPYEETDFGLYVLLPNKLDGWKHAEQAYPRYAGKIFSARFSSKKVNVFKLPRWKIDFAFTGLKDALKILGITDVFTQEANLSAMTNTTQLMVTNVVHKAKIIVNDEGTETAAATFKERIGCAGMSKHFNIRVNRPFLYFVVDKAHRTVLFQGTQTSFP